MKPSLYVLLFAGFFPYQAQALVSETLDAAADITSDTVHSVSDTAGDITDVGLEATVGTTRRIINPGYPRQRIYYSDDFSE